MSGDPENFVSFADYLGLNNDVGQQMLQKTLANQAGQGGDGGYTADQLAGWSKSNFDTAKMAGQQGGGSLAAWQDSNSKLQKGVASYGDFMKGMSDPAARQALLEKTYGAGTASWLDSALTGSSSGLAAAQSKWTDISGQIQKNGTAATDRLAQGQGDATKWAADDAATTARQQASAAAWKADQAKQAQADEDRRVDSWAKAMQENSGGRNVFGDQSSDKAAQDSVGWEYKPYDPNGAQSATPNSAGYNLFYGEGSAASGSTTQRDRARAALAAYEQKTGKTWKTNNSGGSW